MPVAVAVSRGRARFFAAVRAWYSCSVSGRDVVRNTHVDGEMVSSVIINAPQVSSWNIMN